jgi:hypothetical protein
MDAPNMEFTLAGSLDELKAKGRLVLHGDVYLALFHGARRVAADCDGQAPRRERAALESHPDAATLKRAATLCSFQSSGDKQNFAE